MRKLLLLLLVLTFCSPVANQFGLLQLGFLKAFDMPAEAINVAEYEVRLSKIIITQSMPVPKGTFNGTDTLKIWFNYHTPDALPIGELPYTELHTKIVPNNQSLWDVDQDANIPMKEWITLTAGNYQVLITARNSTGEKISGRYDFDIIGEVPIKVFLQGAFQ